MSFLKITDPTKRDQTVKEFLAIKKNIRANELAEKTGKIELQTDLSELFKPVTETQKASTKEITEGLRPVKEGIEQLPQRLPQQIGYPLSMPPSYRSASPLPSTLEEEEEEEEEEGVFPGSDTTFGIYKKNDKLFIGDKAVILDKNNIFIGSYKFNRTPGLWAPITSKNPKEDLIKSYDREAYSFILAYTNAMLQGNNPNNPYPKTSRSLKWRKFLKPIWEVLKQKNGSGVVIPCNPNALLERLDLLP